MLLPYFNDNLFVLAGITPTEFCRKRATFFLARRAIDSEHLLHDRLLSPHQLLNSENSNRGTLLYRLGWNY